MTASNTYLIHGWKVDVETVKKVLQDMKPEAFDRGLRVVFSEKNVDAFLGEVLLSVKLETSGAVIPPSLADGERLQRAMQALGLDSVAMDRPLLWVVAA